MKPCSFCKDKGYWIPNNTLESGVPIECGFCKSGRMHLKEYTLEVTTEQVKKITSARAIVKNGLLRLIVNDDILCGQLVIREE